MDVTFKIDKNNKIVVSTQDDLSNLFRFSNGVAYLIGTNELRYKLMEDFFVEIIVSLNNHLLSILDGQLRVDNHKDVGCGIGYLWNLHEYTMPESDDIYSKYWLWSTSGGMQTWMYQKDKDIIFEVSPSYKWLFTDSRKNECFIPFEKWIEGYKVVLKQKINVKDIQNWLSICQKFIDKLDLHFLVK